MLASAAWVLEPSVDVVAESAVESGVLDVAGPPPVPDGSAAVELAPAVLPEVAFPAGEVSSPHCVASNRQRARGRERFTAR